MATAPRPAAAQKRSGFIITVRDGEPLTISLDDFGPRDSLDVRKATGLALAQLFEQGTFDMDTTAVLWWMARRRNGEEKLTFEEVLTEFPTYGEIASGGDIVLKLEALEGDPEDDGTPLP